jgi:hypothetical protein
MIRAEVVRADLAVLRVRWQPADGSGATTGRGDGVDRPVLCGDSVGRDPREAGFRAAVRLPRPARCLPTRHVRHRRLSRRSASWALMTMSLCSPWGCPAPEHRSPGRPTAPCRSPHPSRTRADRKHRPPMTSPFHIDVRHTDAGHAVIAISGELNPATAPRLHAQGLSLLTDSPCTCWTCPASNSATPRPERRHRPVEASTCGWRQPDAGRRPRPPDPLAAHDRHRHPHPRPSGQRSRRCRAK